MSNVPVLRWVAIISLGLSALGAEGDSVPAMTGFRVPEYDDEGRLKSQLFGERAYFLAGGDVRILELRVEVYEQEGEVLRMTSPDCLYREMSATIESTSTVQIVRGPMTVNGKGFHWDAAKERFEIFSEVYVILGSDAMKMQEGRENSNEGQ